MSQSLWRIATDTPLYQSDDLSGKGAEITGGRWNPKGIPVVYTSCSVALACLETVVHFNAGGLPQNRYLIKIDVPGPIWSAAQVYDSRWLSVGWDAEPPGMTSLELGRAWLQAKVSALMVIPSVIVPEEFNVLINPAHASSSAITATKVRKWLYDPRLVKPQ